MASLVSSLLSFWTSPVPGESEECPLQVQAVPGLTTLLDVALFRTVEGQLTATLTTSHALLAAWLDFKQQAIVVIQEVTQDPNIGSRRPLVESFSRACLEAACDAIERLTTEKLSQTANLSDPYDYSSTTLSSTSSSGMSHHVFSGIATQGMLSALQESSQDTGRRIPLHQRRRDCWESPRLQCPDYTWAEDAHQTCQRLLRQLFKHPYGGDSVENTVLSDSSRQRLSATTEREASLLLQILRTDLAARLSQFRAAMEADSVVSKRLYLVKCEYRAPFRAFLEAHQSVQRAPSVDLVQEYSNLPKSKVEQRRASAKDRLQKLLESPELKEALALEQQCEEFETEMAKELYPFCELARFLDQKRARIKIVPGVVEDDDLIDLQETVRRLRGLLSRKAGPDTSSGIRPLLLDLQGVPRDEERFSDAQMSFKDKAVMERLDELILHLRTLGTLCKARNAFRLEKKMDSFIQYALACAQMAMADAGYRVAEEEAERVGVSIGAGLGGLPEIERQQKLGKEVVFRAMQPSQSRRFTRSRRSGA